MKNIGICVNPKKDFDLSTTNRIIDIISRLGSNCEILVNIC